MRTYLARPAGDPRPGSGVIVFPDAAGFSADTERIADLITVGGSVAIAIDYLHRSTGAENAITDADLFEDVRAAIAWLESESLVIPGKIALWGFGFGAIAALRSANVEGVACAVCFCPDRIPTLPVPGAPALFCVPESDDHISYPELLAFMKQLRERGQSTLLQTYPGVGYHFFYSEHRATASGTDSASAEAVADAWSLAESYLTRNFAKPPRAALHS
ncbi:MAG: hypothetical protein NVS9B12_14660 [Vulcanimicrobiaceae bacterium]